MKIFETQFHNGSYLDNVSKVAGTATSTVFRKTNKGTALYCNASAVLRYPIPSTLPNMSSDFSILINCNLSSTQPNTHPRFFEFAFDANNGICLVVYLNHINASIRLAGTYYSVRSNLTLSDMYDKMNQVVFTKIGTTINLYVNNIRYADAGNHFALGAGHNLFSIGAPSKSTNGILADIQNCKIYNHILTEKEREAEYKQFLEATIFEKPTRFFEYPKPTDLSYEDGLVAAYSPSKDTVQGGQLLDIAGTNHGTISGAIK